MQVDKLTYEIFPTRAEMGKKAAQDVGQAIKEALKKKSEICMIFAAAPSQNEFLEALTADKSIPWDKINAFHMDEYIGLDADAPQGFGNFLRERLFDKVPFKSVNLIPNKPTDTDVAIAEYTAKLKANGVDITCMGIGENGHIAFNDPHVADFCDPDMMKIVELDEKCRVQQVHDGCFESLDKVPTHAFTLTIPVLMSAEKIFCIVPVATKAMAVKETITGEISEKCPATIMRRKPGCHLYLDNDSASLL